MKTYKALIAMSLISGSANATDFSFVGNFKHRQRGAGVQIRGSRHGERSCLAYMVLCGRDECGRGSRRTWWIRPHGYAFRRLRRSYRF